MPASPILTRIAALIGESADPERDAFVATLHKRLGAMGHPKPDYSKMSDDDLRAEGRRVRSLWIDHQEEQRAPKGDRLRTLQDMHSRSRQKFADMSDFADHLENEHSVTVRDDGLIHADRLTAPVKRMIGDNHIVMYHHTSDAREPEIRKHGLVVGKPTNYFNTQAGVYVTTMAGGTPVDLYSKVAARKHGGNPHVFTVKRKLSQIAPDPDDADLEWAQGRQHITKHVPPEDILKESVTENLSARKYPKPAWARYTHPKGRVLYHATAAPAFDAFDTARSDLGAHFGTLEQANHIAAHRQRNPGGEGMRIIPVRLHIRNPLRLKDEGSFHADAIADQLVRKGVIHRDHAKRIKADVEKDWRAKEGHDADVRAAIEKAGYDGVVYKNTQEGAGDSYIAFRPHQIKSAISSKGDLTKPGMTEAKVVPPTNLTVYHGTNKYFAGPLSRAVDREGNQALGPGMYFSSNPEDASGYSDGSEREKEHARVYRTKIVAKPSRILHHGIRPTFAKIHALISAAPADKQTDLANNFGHEEMTPYARREIAQSYVDGNESLLDAAHSLQRDLYRKDTKTWGDAMHKIGYDAAWTERTSLPRGKPADAPAEHYAHHFAIFHPSAIEHGTKMLESSGRLAESYPGAAAGDRLSKPQYVPMRLIHPTEETDPLKVHAIHTHLLSGGDVEPPIVEFGHENDNGEDTLHIVDGHHRHAAHLRAGSSGMYVRTLIRYGDEGSLRVNHMKESKTYNHAEMVAAGADGHLRSATLQMIPLHKLDGLEPVPASDEPDGKYRPGREITQPIEVVHDKERDKYMVYAGNHRIAQARANGATHIKAFVESAGYTADLYHGTAKAFDAFSDEPADGLGHWATDDRHLASLYAMKHGGDAVVPVHVSLKKPHYIDHATYDSMRGPSKVGKFKAFRDRLVARGHDGIVVRGESNTLGKVTVREPEVVVAFHGRSIRKSASPQKESVVSRIDTILGLDVGSGGQADRR